MNLSINHIQHIGIPVTNIVVSEKFYEQLGFEKVMSSTFDYANDKGNVAMMQRDKMIIELYQMPAAALDETRNRKNGHIDHVAFDVPDIDEAFMQLTNAGFAVIEPAPVLLPFWKNGCRYFNLTGPDGERLEFNQIL